jgi:hypothetical protein
MSLWWMLVRNTIRVSCNVSSFSAIAWCTTVTDCVGWSFGESAVIHELRRAFWKRRTAIWDDKGPNHANKECGGPQMWFKWPKIFATSRCRWATWWRHAACSSVPLDSTVVLHSIGLFHQRSPKKYFFSPLHFQLCRLWREDLNTPSFNWVSYNFECIKDAKSVFLQWQYFLCFSMYCLFCVVLCIVCV